jgi:spore coat protein U-like protein
MRSEIPLFVLRWLFRFFGSCLALVCVWPASVWAQDCVIESPPSLSLPSYEPTGTPAAVAWQVKLRGLRGCDARLSIDRLDAMGRLSLQHEASAARLLGSLTTLPTGGSPVPAAPMDALAISLAPGQEKTLVFWLRADAKQWVAAGAYRQNLRLSLAKPTGETMDERDVALSSTVRATARLAFGPGSAGSGASSLARLDFGELRQAAIRSTTLEVLANTAHTLSLSSAGRGRLVNRLHPSSSIPWDLRINGQAIGLTSGQAVLPLNVQGQALHRLEAQIGAIEKVLAGEYADDVLITVTAQ